MQSWLFIFKPLDSIQLESVDQQRQLIRLPLQYNVTGDRNFPASAKSIRACSTIVATRVSPVTNTSIPHTYHDPTAFLP